MRFSYNFNTAFTHSDLLILKFDSCVRYKTALRVTAVCYSNAFPYSYSHLVTLNSNKQAKCTKFELTVSLRSGGINTDGI